MRICPNRSGETWSASVGGWDQIPHCALVWHCHFFVYGPGLYSRDAIWRWPILTDALGDDAGLFYLLVLLSGMAELQELYRQHSIPESVARDTFYDLERWLRRYHAAHGTWGLLPRALTWLRNHTQGRLYQLARLQHQLNTFHGGVHVYRPRGGDRVLVGQTAYKWWPH